jgi:hypothetical protein
VHRRVPSIIRPVIVHPHVIVPGKRRERVLQPHHVQVIVEHIHTKPQHRPEVVGAPLGHQEEAQRAEVVGRFTRPGDAAVVVGDNVPRPAAVDVVEGLLVLSKEEHAVAETLSTAGIWKKFQMDFTFNLKPWDRKFLAVSAVFVGMMRLRQVAVDVVEVSWLLAEREHAVAIDLSTVQERKTLNVLVYRAEVLGRVTSGSFRSFTGANEGSLVAVDVVEGSMPFHKAKRSPETCCAAQKTSRPSDSTKRVLMDAQGTKVGYTFSCKCNLNVAQPMTVN